MGKRTEFERLPHRVRGIISALRRGERLTRSFRRKRNGDCEVIYIYEPSGRSASARAAEAAIATRFVEPLNDGLLGPDTSQTYRATAP